MYGFKDTLTGTLEATPTDPLLGLNTLFRTESNPQKINLGVGIYQDAQGQAPVLKCVKRAENAIMLDEHSKAYIDPKGDPEFIEGAESLLLGKTHAALVDGRVRTVQTPGGSCALRIAADLITRCNPNATIWLSNPTWVNHEPLLGRAGLNIRYYRYYDTHNHGLDFAGMLSSLQKAGPEDVVLLHGCCHNPSGEDLSLDQWQALADLALQRGFTPLVDIAYQGLGAGLDEDAAGLRLLANQLPELLVTTSFSKNFAIYRERLGCLSVIADSSRRAEITLSQILDVIRGYYFVPPTHGSNIVKTVLNNPELSKLWARELEEMKQRIQHCRELFTAQLPKGEMAQRFSHVGRQTGMFSFLGLEEDQVDLLRENYGIYMAASSRVNLSGINPTNVDYLTSAIGAVI